MPWLYLLAAGLFEIGWPIGFKMSQNEATRWSGAAVAIFCIIGSCTFLWMAQKTIPIGTAYAVWTGIGAAGAFLVGVLIYDDPLTFWRVIGVTLIIGGVVTLKLSA